jgi:alkanesulfonate monooxygenase SsuD/methylene tetrahydromethanopterin reductase-like flavin-dependent oxidoreductase (luciferase family)
LWPTTASTSADQIEIFESGWNFDHFYPIDGNAGGPCLEGWMMLAALAQATSRLRMGTLVTGIHYRHPAVLANMIATLDTISAGRLEVGIGAGWNEEESGAYGIELGSRRERSDRFEEAYEAAALGEVGLDLAIVYLRPPLTPAVLEPLAAELARI